MSLHKTGQTQVDPYYIPGPFNPGLVGVDSYNPPIISNTLAFLQLQNLEPRKNRLISSALHSLFQGLGQPILDFKTVPRVNRRTWDFYAFTSTSVYQFNFQTGKFNTPAFYTGFNGSLLPYVFLRWYDALYVTRLGDPYVKLQSSTATVVANAPSARYGVVADSHAFLGGVNDSTTYMLNNFARLRWSDLDDLESFLLNPSSSEADFFDLEPDSGQITGISWQRGAAVIYTFEDLWTSSYVGFPGGFRTVPLFPGLGNIFHDAVVRLKEIDYFIGADGFYTLNGLQVSQLDDGQMYERFISDIDLVDNQSVRGFHDLQNRQIFWVYNSKAHGIWSIVYNYQMKLWCERDPQGMLTFFDSPRVPLRGYDTINDGDSIINNDSDLIKNPNAGYPFLLPQLSGTSTSINQVSGTGLVIGNNLIETFDFYWGNFNQWKEITKVNVEVSGGGHPNLQVQIASRDNLLQTLTYAAAVPVENIDGTYSFFLRAQARGKYMRFKFLWSNTPIDYVSEFLLISFVKVETEQPNENPDR